MTRTTIFLAALAATAANISFPAFAQEQAKTSEVRYADLDLASPQGAQALKVRVIRAAKRVCQADGDRTLESAAQAKACTRIALAKAMPQVELALANAGTQVAGTSRLSVAAH
jgi:UrcA family protein